jgi:hypothetical protein
MQQESIKLRAEKLQRLLGKPGGPAPPSPVPSLKGQPFNLVSLDEWAREWAASEVAILTVAVEGFRRWTHQWILGPLRIDGGFVSGSPGCVLGPPPLLVPAMLSSPLLPKRPEARQYCEGAAATLDAWLRRIRDQLTVMPKMWYPGFAAHLGPTAPPTPALPVPLQELAVLTAPQFVVPMLADELYGKAAPTWARYFGNHQGDLGRLVSDRIAKDMVAYVQAVFRMAMVQGVMGTGQVQGFAPPQYMVGRVMGQTLPRVGFLVGVDAVPSPLLMRA